MDLPNSPSKTIKNSDGPLVFFGAGGAGTAFLENSGIVPAWFVDNNPARQGQKLSGVPILSPDSLGGLREATVVITTGYVREVVLQLDAMGISKTQLVVPPKAALGKQVLRDPANRRRAISSIATLTDSLMPLGKVVLVGGACLGVARSQDLIPWDSDVDLAFPYSKFEEVVARVDAVVDHLEEAGDGRFTGFLELSIEEKLPLAFQFFDVASDYYVDDQFQGNVWRWPIQMFTSPLEIYIAGERLYLPNPPEHYLSQVYGGDWRTPREEFSFLDYRQPSDAN